MSMNVKNFVPQYDNTGKLGTNEKKWAEVNTNVITTNNIKTTINNNNYSCLMLTPIIDTNGNPTEDFIFI